MSWSRLAFLAYKIEKIEQHKLVTVHDLEDLTEILPETRLSCRPHRFQGAGHQSGFETQWAERDEAADEDRDLLASPRALVCV
mmetsp:Transcript_26219/g.47906  ORF Transcript_26219/g.47906 Transcript_26219/m.47906 type:complete len:83 (+) Transcript_26219:175-423(+)